MHLSVIIPAFNEEKLLAATLTALAQATKALTACGITQDVIVCDNNSTDHTPEIAREHGAAVIFEPVNQISRARNTGATLAKGDWLLFLDADCTASRELFEDLAQVLNDDGVLYGGCMVALDEPFLTGKIFVGIWHRLAKWNHWAAGSFLFVRREAFEKTGGFSAELYASEELELSKRLKVIAKQRRKRFAFLTAHPLVTSARKFRFHSTLWHLGFLLRTAVCGARNLRRRESCELWYDGKR